jgi:hypothetical protein
MLSPRSKALWIALPIAVTAVSILGVTKLRQSGPSSVPEGVTQNSPIPAGPDSATAPPQPAQITVPANTPLTVRLDQSIATNRVTSGDPFSATVADPVVIDGHTVIPQGAPVRGRVVADRKSGRLEGVAELSLALESVEVDGNEYNLRTNTLARSGSNHNKRNAEIIGGGGAAGALLGALVGRGKGALIGAPIGAGAGVAGAAMTGEKDIVIPAETPMTFQLLEPVELQLRG